MRAWSAVIGLYLITAAAEIGGCFSVYAWLKRGASPFWLVPGAASLAAFAWLLTLHPTGAAGRTYAAYGGVYVMAAVLWMWAVEHQRPDRWGILGALVCLVGMGIIVFAPRP
jgi:small multidrug resistance family-3 protein